MTYATRNKVKLRLGISASDTTYDAEIDDFLTEAYAWIYNELGSHPSDPHGVLAEVEADRAAGRFATAKFAERGAGPIFLEQAAKVLAEYMRREQAALTRVTPPEGLQ